MLYISLAQDCGNSIANTGVTTALHKDIDMY